MANLTDNLTLLKTGKQSLIDAINGKLSDSDKQTLEIDCEWSDLNALIGKINLRRDQSSTIVSDQIFTDLCNHNINYAITTNTASIFQYAFYNQMYLPGIIAEKCLTIEQYAFQGCSNLKTATLPEVTQVDEYAFASSGLEALNLPKVTTLNDYSFYSCKNLTEVNLPNISTVPSMCFRDDSSLVNVNLSSTNRYTLYSSCFKDCTSFDPASWFSEGKIYSLASNVFYNTGLTSVADSNWTSWSIQDCFSYCNKLTNILFENLKTISTGTFVTACNNLTEISLPKLESVGSTDSFVSAVFSNLPSLETLNLPSLKNVYLYRFFENDYNYANSKMIDLSFPNLETITFKYVSNSLIKYCTALKTFSCDALTSISYNRSSDTSNSPLISYCDSLTTINFSKLSSISCSNFKFADDLNSLASLELPALKTVYFASSAGTYYSNYFLAHIYNLSTLSLPALTSYYAYDISQRPLIYLGFQKLEYLELPALTSIKYITYFIYGANSYTNGGVYFCNEEKKFNAMVDGIKAYYIDQGNPDGYLEDNNYINSVNTFNYNSCSLKKIYLPKLSVWYAGTASWTSSYPIFNNVLSLEELWLGDGTYTPTTQFLTTKFTSGCTNLRRVILNFPIVITLSNTLTDVFYACDFLTGTARTTTNPYGEAYNRAYWNTSGIIDFSIYVPDDLVNSYKTATNWSTYADLIKPISEMYDTMLPDTTTKILDNEYKDNQTLTTMSGPEVTEIGSYAFYNTSASKLNFMLCTSVGDYAFSKSISAKIELSFSKLTAVGKGAFSETNITNLVLSSLTVLQEETAKSSLSLTSISAALATVVNKSAFEGCAALASIELPIVELVYNDAFKNCSSLTSIALPKATTIFENAFENAGLTSVTLDSLQIIRANAFKNCKLELVSIPAIIAIGDHAFANNTEMTSINLYKVAMLGEGVFDGCINLTDITFTADSVPYCGTIPTTCTLHVKANLVDSFKTAFPNNEVLGDAE